MFFQHTFKYSKSGNTRVTLHRRASDKQGSLCISSPQLFAHPKAIRDKLRTELYTYAIKVAVLFSPWLAGSGTSVCKQVQLDLSDLL